MKRTWTVWTTIVTIVFILENVNASFPGFHCLAAQPRIGSENVSYSCTLDCQTEHGAEGGYCGDSSTGDYNCYCGTMTDKIYSNSGSTQCKVKSEKYQKLCEVDCQCNHGASGGMCLWKTHTCGCYGLEIYNDRCPFSTSNEFVKWSADLVGNEA